MRMSLFHGQSMFMGEMTDFFYFILFLFVKRKAFITQLSPTFLSIFLGQSLTHLFLCSAQQSAHFHSSPSSFEIRESRK